MLIALNKPYQLLSQFNPNPGEDEQPTLRDLPDPVPDGVVPLGRLDYDSEGLLLLTDERELEYKLLHPSNKHRRRYHVLVEGQPATDDLAPAREGKLTIRVAKRTHRCLPVKARVLKQEPDFLWPRTPPVRSRQTIVDTWLMLELREGKNRQVRRMTAALGFPTLRLVRTGIGTLALPDLGLKPGQWCALDDNHRKLIFSK
ncbi:MAG: pseudouridine synthase [Verrucomicrobiota bacterium JB023]|nr:pseudouridine synthase [Verrucomicrobiota bacterium JB023]